MFGAFDDDKQVDKQTIQDEKPVFTKSRSKVAPIDISEPSTSRPTTSDQNSSEQKASVKQKIFNSQYMATHPFLRIFVKGDPKMLRTERLTIFLCVIMISIFATGMFYNTDEEDEDDKSIWDIMSDYGWAEFWVVIYTSLITIPVPLTLHCFYVRKPIDPNEIPWVQEQRMLRKRIIGHILVFITIGWSTWSVLAFSLEFGRTSTINWMLSFLGAELFNILIKDNLITLAIVLIMFLLTKEQNAEQAGALRKLLRHFI